MPGVGKTKLILRFVQIVFAKLLYSHIFWMSAATTDKLIEGMARILDIVGHPDRFRSDQNAKLIAARLWLEEPQPSDGVRWLLILDNVDMSVLEFLCEHLPKRNGKGNILFTTRAADVADALVRVSGGRHSTLKLHVPDLVDTADLFFTSAGVDASAVSAMQRSQAEELVQALGSLPLAVVQAASYMKQTTTTLDKMLQISQGERKIEVRPRHQDVTS
jgi:NB-ARC domain